MKEVPAKWRTPDTPNNDFAIASFEQAKLQVEASALKLQQHTLVAHEYTFCGDASKNVKPWLLREGGRWYALRLGPFQTMESAESCAEEIRATLGLGCPDAFVNR